MSPSPWQRLAQRRIEIAVLLGVLLYLVALSCTGGMVWHDLSRDDCEAAFRDSGSADRAGFIAAYYPEYLRQHQRIHAQWLYGFPLMFLGLTIIYFTPTLVAIRRGSPRAEAIFVLNTFCGLSVIGIPILIWMAMKAPRATAPDDRRAGHP